jgi:hypothetical protein
MMGKQEMEAIVMIAIENITAHSQTKWHGVAALYWTKLNRSKPIKTENKALLTSAHADYT